MRPKDLSAALEKAVDAAEERTARLAAEREKMASIDDMKRQFAQAAEMVLAFLKGEKAALEAATPPSTIPPGDTEAIATGKATLAYLEAYASKAAERSEIFVDAKRLADALMAEAEVDNPYTRQSISSLQSAADALEKLVRDKQTFVEGQLARATVDITPEQHAELKGAFAHFDKTGDGQLNRLEFGAAKTSMDLEGDLDDEFAKFVDGARPPPPPGARTRSGAAAAARCTDAASMLSALPTAPRAIVLRRARVLQARRPTRRVCSRTPSLSTPSST